MSHVMATNGPEHWRKPGSEISGRQHRYRAHSQPPSGPKQCALCGSKRFVVIDHKDGNEFNDARSNLRWLCKSHNVRLGLRDARTGRGRRASQTNPGAKTLGAYIAAASRHTRGAHDAGGKIIHETPASKRHEFARQIWDIRRQHGTDKRTDFDWDSGEGMKRNSPIEVTYQIAMAAGQDAGNRHMKAAGRKKWDSSDFNAAALVTQKLMKFTKNPQATSYLDAAGKAAKAGKFAQGMKLLGKYAKKATSEISKEIISRGKPKRNPDADGIYADFHGRKPDKVLDYHIHLMKSGDYAALGNDPRFWLEPVSGDPKKWGDADVWWDEKDAAKLVWDEENRKQLYIVGKNTKLVGLDKAGFDTSTRFVVLGVAHGLSYDTEKVFDQKNGNKTTWDTVTYAHVLGEETGEKPLLIYDQETGTPILVGGAYYIKEYDPELGASPGIAN